jgi:hypothetical protein
MEPTLQMPTFLNQQGMLVGFYPTSKWSLMFREVLYNQMETIQ